MIAKMIKDPIHGFIDFEGQFENDLREVLGDPFFQRLRKVKQLGFSDHIFPSATHTRFAHSLGVYCVARRMLGVIETPDDNGNWSYKGKACLAAALLHDIGHGMFSHAFENAMTFFIEGSDIDEDKKRALGNAVDHEKVSERIILETSIADQLKKIGGAEFPETVAAMIAKTDPNCIYTSIVSSQLDADRLDYMKRDPYFAGVSSGSVDLDWIIRNLKISENGAYFYFDSKAYISMEQFSVTLFQLYPTIYLHKKTRALEIMFSQMLAQVFSLISQAKHLDAGLNEDHPFVRFYLDPSDLSASVLLDDTVLWGSMYLLRNAKDEIVSNLAARISNRKIFSMLDVWKIADEIFSQLNLGKNLSASQRVKLLNHVCPKVIQTIKEEGLNWHSTFHYDNYSRQVYKPQGKRGGDPQQINIMLGNECVDIFEMSPLVSSSASFHIHRIYYDESVFHDISGLEQRLRACLREQISRDSTLLDEVLENH
ncbi:MAG: HD domain-containing protein [Paracoccaceae bacterium]